MVDIPMDILLYIVQFIPETSLQNMLSVNSVFFNIAMDNRYKEVSINDLSPQTRKILARLMDPVVGRRVHRLDVRPLFQKERGQEKDLLQLIYATLRTRILSAMPGHADWPVGSPPKSANSFEDTIKSVIEVIPGLVNVTEFTIDSWYLPPGYDIQPFFTTAWSSFGRNLRKLSLGGNLEGFRAFTTSRPHSHLCSLQELSLDFANNQFRVDEAAEGTILLEDVLPFVNGLGSQLRHLKVSSWGTVDLSSFFMALRPFAVLQRFSIRAAFNKAFRTDPSGLTRFLHVNSATLQHVGLRLNPTRWAIEPTSEQLLSEWMSEGIAHTATLANLQVLQIYPTLLPAGLDALAVYLRRSSDTLTTLVVRDRYLLYDEVDIVVGAFGHRSAENGLKSLRLNVRTLTVELIDLLAETLPGLEELALYIGDAVTEDHASTIETFRTKMQGCSYKNWRLYDIGLWQSGSKLDYETMHLLARCIPSVRSFWDSGNMKGDPMI